MRVEEASSGQGGGAGGGGIIPLAFTRWLRECGMERV